MEVEVVEGDEVLHLHVEMGKVRMKTWFEKSHLMNYYKEVEVEVEEEVVQVRSKEEKEVWKERVLLVVGQ